MSAVELIALVGHLGQAHIRRASGQQRQPTGRRGDLQCLLAGPDSRVQAALRALDLGEFVAAPCGDTGRRLHGEGYSGLRGRLPPCDTGSEGTLGLGKPTVQPLGDAQMNPGDGS